jgi:hypothetical protein
MVPALWRRAAPFIARHRVAFYSVTALVIPALIVSGVLAGSSVKTIETAGGIAFCLCMFASMTAAGLLLGAAYYDVSTAEEERPGPQSAFSLFGRVIAAAEGWGVAIVLLFWFGLAAMFLVPIVNELRN